MQERADALAKLCEGSPRILLTGPVGLDGDSIGATLALAKMLRTLNPSCTAVVAGDPGFRYAGLPGAEGLLRDAQVLPDWDVVIVMDGDKTRLSAPVEAAFIAAPKTAIVDHHGTTGAAGYDVVILEPAAESTCGMVVRILDAWGQELDAELAHLLYTGIIFDTGCFRYSNTEAQTHRMAARMLDTGFDHAQVAIDTLMDRRIQGMRLSGRVLDTAVLESGGQLFVGQLSLATMAELDATGDDMEGIVNEMLYVHGVQVAVLVSERSAGVCKASFRSRGKVNVAQLARSLTVRGGGHAKAAGATLMMDLPEARELVVQALTRALE